jgi:hypothetical protein
VLRVRFASPKTTASSNGQYRRQSYIKTMSRLHLMLSALIGQSRTMCRSQVRITYRRVRVLRDISIRVRKCFIMKHREQVIPRELQTL